jgi:uroporphyrinogen decarboxylase
MKTFIPDYRHVEQAARNQEAVRLPLYEHLISVRQMEKILGASFAGLMEGDLKDQQEFFRQYCRFFQTMGYDTVSFECCIGAVMPGSGSLGGHKPGVIRTRSDFDRYPWAEVPDLFFQRYATQFQLLREMMPAGMKAIGGPGNGIFECVQDVVGYMDLCYIRADDPDLFCKVGETNLAIWQRFLPLFKDLYCVLRFGDDLGFKSTTLLPADDIRQHIIPGYRRIIDAVHAAGKPFLLHSCGQIFDVMEDMITVAGIDAKHSNEDQIAPFPVWVERYGDRIGNFGGIDTDAVCLLDAAAMRSYIQDVIRQCTGHGGFAFGSGNSIPDYVPTEGYLTMVETVREYRGDTRA